MREHGLWVCDICKAETSVIHVAFCGEKSEFSVELCPYCFEKISKRSSVLEVVDETN